MNKNNILKKIQYAKPDHIELIKEGHRLLQGAPQEQLLKPEACNECAFGKWYYQEGYKLVNIPQLKELEILHKEIHSIYTVLYYVTFDRRVKARTSVISGGFEVPIEEKAFRQKKLKQLEKQTVTMIRSLDKIEMKVASMNDQDFKSGWFQ